jgi:hypothetical protein
LEIYDVPHFSSFALGSSVLIASPKSAIHTIRTYWSITKMF